jgi:MFS family permease
MRWRIVPLLMVFVALAHFNRLSISVAGAEQIIRPGLLDERQMGLVYTAFLLSYTAFMLPGGWFTDRFGPRAAWMVVGFGSAAGVALTGLTGLAFTGPGALLAGLIGIRAALGACNAPLHPSGARIVANWIPPDGVSFANGLIGIAACTGIALTYLVFGALIDRFGWPQAFLISGGVTLLVAVLWAVTASDYPSGAPGHIPEDAGVKFYPGRDRERGVLAPRDLPRAASDASAPLQGPGDTTASAEKGTSSDAQAPADRTAGPTRLLGASLLYLTLSYATVNYFQYLFFYWAQYYFEKVLQLSKEAARQDTTWLGVAMGTGMMVGGWLSDWATAHLGPRRGLALVPVGGLVLGALVTALGAFSREPGVVRACFVTAMAAVGTAEAAYWVTAVRLGGTRGGTAAGILNTGGNVGGLLAPIVTPWVGLFFGWQAGPGLASVACIAGAALWAGVCFPSTAGPPSSGKSIGSSPDG